MLQQRNGRVSYDIGDYRNTLDECSRAFEEDHAFLGGDWPNGDPLGSFGQVGGVFGKFYARSMQARVPRP